MARIHVAALACLVAQVACHSKERAPDPSARSAAILPSQTPSPPPAKPASVGKERVTELVDRWRVSQEQNDFESYRALYAPTFRGVKRAGNKTARFDRAGWLKDRRQLFRLDVKVSVKELRVFTGERSALATFVQEWASPRFRDVGPKRLELALHQDKLLITREEMIESSATAASAVKAPPPEELSLLWGLPHGFGATLKHGSIPTRGPPRKLAMSDWRGDFLLEKDPTEAAVKPFASFRGRELDLYNGGGVTCKGKVVGFRVIGGFTNWDPKEPLDQVWRALGDEHYLVAVVEPDHSECDAFWARASDLPKPIVFTSRKLNPAETERAGRALAKTETSVETQTAYDSFRRENDGLLPDLTIGAPPKQRKAAPPRWEDLESRQWSAFAFTHPGTGASYVVGEVRAGVGCGSFSGHAVGFFKAASPEWIDLTGDGSPGLRFPVRPLFGLVPDTAVALEPGGRVYMIGVEGLYADTGAGFAPISTIGRTRTTCDC